MIRALSPGKRRLLALAFPVLLGAAIGRFCWIGFSPSPAVPGSTAPAGQGLSAPERADAPAPPSGQSARFIEKSASGEVSVPETFELARQLNASDTTAQQDVEVLQTLVAFYRRGNNGAIPGGGLNEEIVEALRGRNAKGLAVLPAELSAIRFDGQLVDRWGTPYFLHPVSSDTLEIRSAGPDGKLWTADDVVTGEDEAARVAR